MFAERLYPSRYFPRRFFPAVGAVPALDIVEAIRRKYNEELASAFGDTASTPKLWLDQAKAGTSRPFLVYSVTSNRQQQERPDGILWEWLVTFWVNGVGDVQTQQMTDRVRATYYRFWPTFTVGYAIRPFKNADQDPVPRNLKGVGTRAVNDWQQATSYTITVFRPGGT